MGDAGVASVARRRTPGLVSQCTTGEGSDVSLIRVRSLTRLYRMGDSIVRALNGVDLDVRSGEFVAITGPSGSGKSTMMHLLGCLDRPTAGEYVLNGRRVSDLDDRELARIRNRDIGFVFQTFNLINRTTALENVSVPMFYARKANTRAAAMRALERVGLDHRATHRPNELSGGERQRVAIARAIVNDPVFLLADEPTGNLDTRTGAQIMEVFHALNRQGVTIVIVTHEPEIALQARRIVQMRDGRIVADRPAEEFIESGEIQRPSPVARLSTAGVGDGESRAVADAPSSPAAEDLSALPQRVARGANATLWCGVFSIVSAFVAVVIGAAIPRPVPGGTGSLPIQPSAAVSALALGATILLLSAVVSGVAAMFLARGVLRRTRLEPGNWLGRGRARLGGILGGLVIAIPLLSVGYGIVVRLVRTG